MKTNGSIGTAAAIAFVLPFCFAATLRRRRGAVLQALSAKEVERRDQTEKTTGTVPFTASGRILSSVAFIAQ